MRSTNVRHHYRQGGKVSVVQHTRHLEEVPEREKYEKPEWAKQQENVFTLDNVKTDFENETRKIWGEKVADYVNMDYVLDNNLKTDMAITTFLRNGNHPYAVGNNMIRMNKEYTLHIKPEFLKNNTRERIDKTIRHEVLHLGHFRHTDEFFKLAKEHNATLTKDQEEHPNLPPYQIQIKEGHRFKTIERFQTEEEALNWGKDYYHKNDKPIMRIIL